MKTTIRNSDTDLNIKAPQKIMIEDSQALIHDSAIVKDGAFAKIGTDLHIHHDDNTYAITDYFTTEDRPDIVTDDQQVFTPNLINSFMNVDPVFASGATMNDESPVGRVQELTGKAVLTRTDGTIEVAELGTPIYQGDIVETGANSAVNVVFTDDTHFAISDNARLSIDEYVFNADTNEGTTDFSVLKGLFVFTSGLIGREDPDDVNIDTPMGSIGIRGTIIAGNTDTGEVTVVEGAIVLRDFSGNEITLADRFETAQFNPAEGKIDMIGTLAADDVGVRFESVSDVAGSLFSSIESNAITAPVNNNDADSTPIQPATQPDSSAKTQQNDPQDTVETPPQGDTESIESTQQPNDDPIETMQNQLEDRAEAIIEILNENKQTPEAQIASTQNALDNLLQAMQSLIGANSTGLNALHNQLSLWALYKQQAVNNSIFNNNGSNENKVQLTDYAPEEFFAGLDTQTWTYDFSLEFVGPTDETLTYRLGTNTDKTISALEDRAFINDVNFDETTGVLDIDFNALALFGPNTENFDFSIFNSLSSTRYHVDFNLYKGFLFNESMSGSRVFLNDSGGIFTASRNGQDIIMGDGGRTVKLTDTYANNTVIGGAENDTVVVNGNDIAQKLQGTGAHEINFMHNPLSSSGTDSFGDILKLQDTNIGTPEAIDFSKISTINNVETIDILQGNFNVKLSANDVFQMTNSDNILIFKADNKDTIAFDADDKWQSTGEAETRGDQTYNEYQAVADGNTVTVLVDASVNPTGI